MNCSLYTTVYALLPREVCSVMTPGLHILPLHHAFYKSAHLEIIVALYYRGRQTTAHGPHAALRTFASISSSFSKNCVCLSPFISIAKYRNIVRWSCGSLRAVQYYFCKSFKKELMSQKRRLQIYSCFQIFMLRLFVALVLRYAAHS